jgi:hypothetical protein
MARSWVRATPPEITFRPSNLSIIAMHQVNTRTLTILLFFMEMSIDFLAWIPTTGRNGKTPADQLGRQGRSVSPLNRSDGETSEMVNASRGGCKIIFAFCAKQHFVSFLVKSFFLRK